MLLEEWEADPQAWEFYLRNAWNFMTAAWGAYNITMITEVAPAPKMFLFMSLFNTVGVSPISCPQYMYLG